MDEFKFDQAERIERLLMFHHVSSHFFLGATTLRSGLLPSLLGARMLPGAPVLTEPLEQPHAPGKHRLRIRCDLVTIEELHAGEHIRRPGVVR